MQMRRSKTATASKANIVPATSIVPAADAWLSRLADNPFAFRSFLTEIVRMDPWKDYWGHDPHRANPVEPPVPYNPKYVALLYLRLADDWTIEVNHACYGLTPAETASADLRLDKAIAILEERVSSGDTFGELGLPNHPPYPHVIPDIHHDQNRLLDSGSFKDFKFKSQNEIFIFLHHPDVDVKVYENRLLGFKMQGAADNEIKHPNDTFYNARAVPSEQTGSLEDEGTLIRVENYATGVSTTPMYRHYSMDIKFQIEGGEDLITMVVDPDTGNGTGYEP